MFITDRLSSSLFTAILTQLLPILEHILLAFLKYTPCFLHSSIKTVESIFFRNTRKKFAQPGYTSNLFY